MDCLKDIEEIVEIIARKSPVKDKIMEITKTYLDYYNLHRYEYYDIYMNLSEYKLEYLLQDIVDVALSGYTKGDKNIKRYEFEEGYISKCPVAYFDIISDAPKEYIKSIENLLKMQGIKLDLENIEYPKNSAIYHIDCEITIRLKEKGYVLGCIIFKNLPEFPIDYVFILEEEYLQKITRILEKNTELSEFICIEECIL